MQLKSFRTLNSLTFMNKKLYLILLLGFFACNTQKIATSNQKIFTKADLQGDYKLNGGFVNIRLSLVDTIFHYIARGCKGGVRTEGTWHYKADTLYLNITKTIMLINLRKAE
jgi:hypothetical protein